MKLPLAMIEQMKALASESYPNEAVALIGFDRDHNPASLVKLANRASDPTQMFLVLPYEQYEAEMALKRSGFYVGAIFHSHPTGKPRPSAIDLEMYEEGQYMVIAGRNNPEEPEITWTLCAWEGAREVLINDSKELAA